MSQETDGFWGRLLRSFKVVKIFYSRICSTGEIKTENQECVTADKRHHQMLKELKEFGVSDDKQR